MRLGFSPEIIEDLEPPMKGILFKIGLFYRQWNKIQT